MILHCRRELVDCFRKYLLVDVSCGEVGLQPVFWVLVFVVVRQAILLLDLVVLVIAGIYNN